ncbi:MULTISPECIES: histidine kinase [Metasolibacillus]|uniref:sensor histidine kinase n=1 Tax=Metasolibacillus TaxID=2703677 RepID=UPI000ACD5EBC|nr:histidine kinase [Metasolibacillus fluoroglycofenilyticus]
MKESEVEILAVENRKIRLEKELEVSKYNQLSQQIQPHFLFNVLNTLMSLLRLKKYDELIQSMEQFIMFLKYKYEIKDHTHLIYNELKHTQNYLNIQSMRFGSRLHTNIEVDEKLLGESIIPYLIQTLVENTFKHGFDAEMEVCQIKISLYRETDDICLIVEDNGRGIDTEVQYNTGLSNIETRLNLLYGKHAELKILPRAVGSGVKVFCRWNPSNMQELK